MARALGYYVESFRNTEQGAGVEPGERKRALRAELAALPHPGPETRERVVEHVSRWLLQRRPQVVVGFLAMGDEIDMAPLVSRHPDIRFGLTRTAPGVTLTVHDFAAPRETHRFGFEQPAASAPRIEASQVDTVLVPGLAFGSDGRRLGRGAGYYDRFLAVLDADKIGITTSGRIREGLPLESHDVLMDWIATEEGIVRST